MRGPIVLVPYKATDYDSVFLVGLGDRFAFSPDGRGIAITSYMTVASRLYYVDASKLRK